MVSSNDYIEDIRPVAKEAKTLELMEKNLDRVAYGFEASFDEIADFFQRTYKLGALKAKMIREAGSPSKFKIMLLAESIETDGELSFDNDLSVCSTSLSADGEIINTFSSDFMGYEEDLFHYFGLELRDEKKRLLPVITEAFTL